MPFPLSPASLPPACPKVNANPPSLALLPPTSPLNVPCWQSVGAPGRRVGEGEVGGGGEDVLLPQMNSASPSGQVASPLARYPGLGLGEAAGEACMARWLPVRHPEACSVEHWRACQQDCRWAERYSAALQAGRFLRSHCQRTMRCTACLSSRGEQG